MKREHKKKISLALAAAFISVTVAGCSSGAGDSKDGAATGKPQTETNQGGKDSPATGGTTTDNGGQTPENGKADQAKLLEEYEKVVSGAKSASDIVAFLDSRLKETDPATADAMLVKLDAYYEANLEAAQNEFFVENVQTKLQDVKYPVTAQSVADVKDEAVRKLLEKALAGKYKIESQEGSLYPIVDYEALKAYAPYLSDAMKAYVDLMAIESNDKTASDGGLTLSWDEMAARVLAAEHTLREYPQSPKVDAVKAKYKQYVQFYLFGLNNTPIYDWDSFKLLAEVKTSYAKTVKEHPDTILGQLTKQFLDVLGKTKEKVFVKKDGQQTDLPEVKAFRDSIDSQIDSLLK